MTLNTCMQIFKLCSRKAESFLQQPGLQWKRGMEVSFLPDHDFCFCSFCNLWGFDMGPQLCLDPDFKRKSRYGEQMININQ